MQNNLPAHTFVSPYNQVRRETRLLYLLLRCQFRVSRSAPNEPVSFSVVSRSPHIEKLLQSLSDRVTPLGTIHQHGHSSRALNGRVCLGISNCRHGMFVARCPLLHCPNNCAFFREFMAQQCDHDVKKINEYDGFVESSWMERNNPTAG